MLKNKKGVVVGRYIDDRRFFCANFGSFGNRGHVRLLVGCTTYCWNKVKGLKFGELFEDLFGFNQFAKNSVVLLGTNPRTIYTILIHGKILMLSPK